MKTRPNRLVMIVVLAVLFLASLSLLGYANFRSGMPLGFVFLNSLILAVPLVLLYFGLGVIIDAVQQHRQGQVSPRTGRVLYMAPRVAGILLALFIGLFALDVFDMPGSFWAKIGAFLMHAAPSIILLVLMALAWRWEWVGALVFGLAALFLFVISVIPRSIYGLGNLFLFVLPAAVIAVLFWLDWRWRNEIRPARGAAAQ